MREKPGLACPFAIRSGFFPGDPDAWEKLQHALKASIDPEAFEQMHGTVSFPFQPGEHQRIAVKVIDFRGNEVVRAVSPSPPWGVIPPPSRDGDSALRAYPQNPH
jgi:hypothetical protein